MRLHFAVKMDRVFYFLWLFAICNPALALPFGRAAPDPNSDRDVPIVTLRNGSYFGIHSNRYRQDFFLGIPFAQPPVGDLRLRLPASLNTTWTGIRNATEYSPACFGYGEDTQIGAGNYCSEDCLALNVVRPSGYEQEKLPIAVWIYGSVRAFGTKGNAQFTNQESRGGFYEGSNRDPRYNLSFIVEQSVEISKPIIGVSINYRLHGWGFLYSQDVLNAGVANLGLRDQRYEL